ncbi:MAG: hypothetical protein FWD88_06630, partial [Treponema sp.]|nr:hypothetical protein [Treponema sp.]
AGTGKPYPQKPHAKNISEPANKGGTLVPRDGTVCIGGQPGSTNKAYWNRKTLSTESIRWMT